MPQVYLLHCSDNTYYTGWATDVNKRLASHNQGTASRYTRSRLPVTLVYVEEVLDKSDALKREYQIRHLNRKEKEALAAAYALKFQEE
ncbi:MAG: GIY-YIG nuclease family protein [Bacillota bacterium]|nr:GIY-YIG nuclease family protein [Bacillota bacterium]MDW7677871.1 GIY-YIG nuclease family protein [Bacillota bacterium]